MTTSISSEAKKSWIVKPTGECSVAIKKKGRKEQEVRTQIKDIRIDIKSRNLHIFIFNLSCDRRTGIPRKCFIR